jgi:hypothetical protein
LHDEQCVGHAATFDFDATIVALRAITRIGAAIGGES